MFSVRFSFRLCFFLKKKKAVNTLSLIRSPVGFAHRESTSHFAGRLYVCCSYIFRVRE